MPLVTWGVTSLWQRSHPWHRGVRTLSVGLTSCSQAATLSSCKRRGPQPCVATKGPRWGYPRLVLGALGSFLEPFDGGVLPKVDKLCLKLTFEIPPRRALRGDVPTGVAGGLRWPGILCTVEILRA